MFLTETMLPHFKLSAFRFSLWLFLVTVLNTENKMKEGLRVANKITLLFVRTSVRLLTVYFFQKIKIYWTSVNNGTAKQTTQKVGSSLQIQNPLSPTESVIKIFAKDELSPDFSGIKRKSDYCIIIFLTMICILIKVHNGGKIRKMIVWMSKQ